MYNIDELILYHHEGEYLDFKREEYNDHNKPHLIKDILAFANANVKGDKYIIIGVEKKGQDIKIFNIDSKYDSAHIQQYVHANITPELTVEYIPHKYEGKTLMILKIISPSDQPYMTIKDVTYPKGGKVSLKANECWIRKGSYQLTATRGDIDKMYAAKIKESSFNGEIIMSFSEDGGDRIIIESIKNIEFPSEINRKKLEELIQQKEGLKEKNPTSYQLSIIQPLVPWQGTRYEERSIETLKKNLENVEDIYAEEDWYYLFEEKGFKLNMEIYNNGNNYLEDATIEIKIPKIETLIIADQVHVIHQKNSNPLVSYSPRVSSFDELNYPTVKEENGHYIVTEELGDIKHHIKMEAFKTPIRLVVGEAAIGADLKLQCKIFGKNLTAPIEKSLTIKVVS